MMEEVNSVNNVSNFFNSVYRFVVGLGLFIMALPFVLLWFLTFMKGQIYNAIKETSSNFVTNIATDSEIFKYNNYYTKYIDIFCNLSIWIVFIGFVFITIGCVLWLKNEQIPKDKKLKSETAVAVNKMKENVATNVEKAESDKDEFDKNDDNISKMSRSSKEKKASKNVLDDKSKTEHLKSIREKSIRERIKIINDLRTQFYNYLKGKQYVDVIRNLKIRGEDKMPVYICDFLAISNDGNDVVYDIKLSIPSDTMLKYIIKRFEEVHSIYQNKYRRNCSFRIVYMLEGNKFEQTDLSIINSTINGMTNGYNISAEKYKIIDSKQFVEK